MRQPKGTAASIQATSTRRQFPRALVYCCFTWAAYATYRLRDIRELSCDLRQACRGAVGDARSRRARWIAVDGHIAQREASRKSGVQSESGPAGAQTSPIVQKRLTRETDCRPGTWEISHEAALRDLASSEPLKERRTNGRPKQARAVGHLPTKEGTRRATMVRASQEAGIQIVREQRTFLCPCAK